MDKPILKDHKELVRQAVNSAEESAKGFATGQTSILRATVESNGVQCICVIAVREMECGVNQISD